MDIFAQIMAVLAPVVAFLLTYLVTFVLVFGIMYIMLTLFLAAEAIPVFMIAKKLGRPKPWLAWLFLIPVAGPFLLQYAIMDLAGDKPFALGDKIKFAKRSTSWLIWVGVTLGGTLLAVVLALVLGLIPFVGPFLAVLVWMPIMLIIVAVAVVVNFVHLRDVLELYYEEKQTCMILSLAICIGDVVCTGGLAEIVLLWLIAFREPLAASEEETLPQDENNC